MGSIKTWFIAYKKRGELFDTTGFKRIKAPEGKYYADPFLYKNFIFFEDFDHKKGVISYVEILEDGVSKAKKAIEEDYHLSFPSIFEDEGEIYMTPESGVNQSVNLYRAKKFPDEWEFVRTLHKPVIAADPIIYEQDGSYYLFLTNHGDNNLEIWKSDSLMGEFKICHRDQYWNSRSAGHIFKHNGRLIRPVQDCKELYGRGIVFKEINIEPYTERVISTIEPDWAGGLIGTHTFNFNDDFVVIDGKYETTLD